MFVIPTKYHRGFNFPQHFNIVKYIKLKNHILGQNIDEFKLTQRIGSESLHAKVYEAIISDCAVAIKILKKFEKLENEKDINERVSNPDYFLFMIESLECEGKGIIIMELAISDLKQRLTLPLPTESDPERDPNGKVFELIKSFTVEDLNRMFSEVIESLIQLASLQVYHGDLHIGNIFFVNRNCQTRTVIGDFGESSISNSPTSSSSDVFYFINSLREFLPNGSFRSKVDTFFNGIGKIAGKYEILFDQYLETMSENEAIIRSNKNFLYQCLELWGSI